jgi:hypothetical protein
LEIATNLAPQSFLVMGSCANICECVFGCCTPLLPQVWRLPRGSRRSGV